jgi:hypothetical protein
MNDRQKLSRTARVWATLAAVVAAVASTRGVAAQSVNASQAPSIPPLVVSVRVIDSAGIAVEGADATILVGLSESKTSGVTDPSGHVSLTVTEPQGDYQLVVRKIGYNRSDQFFHAKSGRLAFDVVMHRTTQSLAPVTVTAQQDLKRKSYFIDADEIAKHADELIDASDILRKLKPDMICGRVCDPWGTGVPPNVRTAARACPISNTNPGGCPRTTRGSRAMTAGSAMSRTNAWVNGRRILTIATDDVCQAGKRGPLAGLSAGTMQVLCEIRPEHIEQIQYNDDWDNSVGKVGSNNALFIVLKEGVVYEPGAPSYVRDAAAVPGVQAALPGVQTMAPAALDAPLRRDSIALPDDVASAGRDSASVVPVYRYRVLGVYDQESGDPVEGARVVDVKTGTYANTTTTGTVTLIFLPEGGSLLRISKAGYEDVSLSVDIGPMSATPLTLLMKKKS